MFEIPSVPTLVDRQRRALQGDETLRRSDAEVYARVSGGGLAGLYAYQEWAARQISHLTCDDDVLLDLHVPLWLREGRRPAVAGAGWVTVRGVADAPVRAGVELTRADGALYRIRDGVVIGADGTARAAVEAVEPGFAGNVQGGAWLAFVSTPARVQSEAQLDGNGVRGGADSESIASLRSRISERQRAGGEVGKGADYIKWAKEVPGVTRAWCAPKLAGIGSVTVFFMRDGDPVGFPGVVECAAVRSHLEQTGLPFGEVFAVPPQDFPVNFKIKVTPDTPAVRDAVTKALAAAIAEEAAPIACRADGAAVQPLSGVTILRSHLTEAISGAAGEEDHKLIEPVGDIVCRVGDLARLGVIQWM